MAVNLNKADPKLTHAVKDRFIQSFQLNGSELLISFVDGSTMTVTIVGSNSPLLHGGARIRQISESQAKLFFEFEDESALDLTIVDPGNSVIVRDKNSQVEYLEISCGSDLRQFYFLHPTVGLASKVLLFNGYIFLDMNRGATDPMKLKSPLLMTALGLSIALSAQAADLALSPKKLLAEKEARNLHANAHRTIFRRSIGVFKDVECGQYAIPFFIAGLYPIGAGV